ncbi:surface lipoprotein assembly modifier [Suttonella sp. R2A3]|uniref:surface lipoprotein assembly modifier n=1 Tax=Suttonella sp. R2A3 TaxID=2908648 RepID=UPI001F1CB211|nr:surface lipoprotein assembly modifier [Suttonella sp. R2A3]UJF24680.1 surface lipoprotein assembly modifier [Suttonella sp. R2A3]
MRTLLLLNVLLFSMNGIAQTTIPIPSTPHFQQDNLWAVDDLPYQSIADSSQQSPTQNNATSINEQDIRNNLPLAEELINQALRQQQWPLLTALLAIYPQIQGYDPVLLDYAQGALHRQEGRQKSAITAYRRIIAKAPELSNVRLDLAIMLYEDKQFAAAKDQFQRLRANEISEEMRAIANVHLERIERQSRWQSNVNIEYLHNNNINNASPVRVLSNGARKNDESMPKSGTGLRYFIGAERNFNIAGNHYAHLNLDFSDTYYHKQADYREQTFHLSAGYQYQTIDQWFKISPFIERNRLGGEFYSTLSGASLEYGAWITPHQQWIGRYTLTHKNYDDDTNARFAGNSQELSLTSAYLFSASSIIYGGVDLLYDDLQAKEASSWRYGVRLGWSQEWSGGLSTNANLRYAQRNFLEKTRPIHCFLERLRFSASGSRIPSYTHRLASRFALARHHPKN